MAIVDKMKNGPEGPFEQGFPEKANAVRLSLQARRQHALEERTHGDVAERRHQRAVIGTDNALCRRGAQRRIGRCGGFGSCKSASQRRADSRRVFKVHHCDE